jgi:hypothetical protein
MSGTPAILAETLVKTYGKTRVTADIFRNRIIILATWAIGLLVGFRPTGTSLQCVEATALVLFTSFVFSWLEALIMPHTLRA